jgi:hypothetical protein
MSVTFFQVARRPKWIAGLLLAMITAGIFAGLMQWQLSRTFVEVGISEEIQQPMPLSEFAQPGKVFPGAYDRLATAEVELDLANSFIVENRLQLVDGEQRPGYWLIANSTETSTGASLTLALAFSEDPAELELELPAGKLEITGYVQPSDPIRTGDQYLGSVSLAQLVNLYSDEPFESYPVYLIVQQGVDLPAEQIAIGIRQQEIEINWLTAFYAVEWAFFALAAFYLWWRLVKDQVIRESAL